MYSLADLDQPYSTHRPPEIIGDQQHRAWLSGHERPQGHFTFAESSDLVTFGFEDHFGGVGQVRVIIYHHNRTAGFTVAGVVRMNGTVHRTCGAYWRPSFRNLRQIAIEKLSHARNTRPTARLAKKYFPKHLVPAASWVARSVSFLMDCCVQWLFKLRKRPLNLIWPIMMSATRRSSPTQRRPILPVLVLLLSSCLWPACLLVAADQGEVLSKEGQVDFSRRQAQWSNAIPGQKLEAQDRLRTRALSRALVRLIELGRVRLDELTTLEILPPRNPNSKGTLDLKAGAIYFFTRDRPREFEIRTPQALAASRGTEFLVSLQDSGREVFTMFDGEAEVS